MNMKTACVLAAIVLGAHPAASAQTVRSAGRIAYVSVQKLATESNEAKVASAKLETMRMEKAREVEARQKAVDAAQLAVVQAGGIFQRSRRATLVAEENRQRAELQRVAQQAQADLQNLQRQLQSELRVKINAVLERFVRQRNLEIVLNQDTTIVWAPPGADLTMEVLSALNAASPSPPSAPAETK
jgi:Skp family chaperone for outer membrane proteins